VHFPSRVARGFLVATAAALVVLSASAQDNNGKMSDGIGLVANGKADMKDVGLAAYPGSRPYKDKDDDSSTATLGMWGPSSGFHLSMVKFESSDSPEKIATFYRKELSQYGKVLDCSDPKAPRGNNGKELSCDDEKPDKGELALKAGTKQNQHLVGIEQRKDGMTKFQLVHLETKGSD
jgi:hypothetical protein